MSEGEHLPEVQAVLDAVRQATLTLGRNLAIETRDLPGRRQTAFDVYAADAFTRTAARVKLGVVQNAHLLPAAAALLEEVAKLRSGYFPIAPAPEQLKLGLSMPPRTKERAGSWPWKERREEYLASKKGAAA